MTARELEQAAADLRRRRRQRAEAGVLAAAAVALAIIAAVRWPGLVLPFAVGAALELAIAAGAVVARRERISRLALEPAAYALPEVECYGRRLTDPGQRARLSAWISEILSDAHLPGNLYLADRVVLFRRELLALARELALPSRRVQPESAAACRRLLTRAVESPLYNPRLTTEDLRLALERIRAGIQRA